MWVACEDSEICGNFMSNVGIQNVFAKFLLVTNVFVIKEMLVWLEISRLPLCAWNSSIFKKVALLWGNILFSDDDELNNLAVGNMCIKMGVMAFIQEKVMVGILLTE